MERKSYGPRHAMPVQPLFIVGTKNEDGVKNALPYGIGQALCVDAPTLDDARWVCECEVEQHVTIGQSDTFFCRIRNIQIDAEIDVSAGRIDLTQFDPVIYSGNYHSIGDYLGKIGEFF